MQILYKCLAFASGGMARTRQYWNIDSKSFCTGLTKIISCNLELGTQSTSGMQDQGVYLETVFVLVPVKNLGTSAILQKVRWRCGDLKSYCIINHKKTKLSDALTLKPKTKSKKKQKHLS